MRKVTKDIQDLVLDAITKCIFILKKNRKLNETFQGQYSYTILIVTNKKYKFYRKKPKVKFNRFFDCVIFYIKNSSLFIFIHMKSLWHFSYFESFLLSQDNFSLMIFEGVSIIFVIFICLFVSFFFIFSSSLHFIKQHSTYNRLCIYK